MSKPYTPRSGSHGERVLAILIANPGVEFSGAELRAQLEDGPQNLTTTLKPLIDAGLVQREGSNVNARYSLAGPPPPSEPSDGRLTIAAYSDGDTHVTGGAPTDEGVLYTQAQLAQLLAFVTRPHLQQATAEKAA